MNSVKAIPPVSSVNQMPRHVYVMRLIQHKGLQPPENTAAPSPWQLVPVRGVIKVFKEDNTLLRSLDLLI